MRRTVPFGVISPSAARNLFRTIASSPRSCAPVSGRYAVTWKFKVGVPRAPPRAPLYFHRRGLLERHVTDDKLTWHASGGLSVDASVHIAACDRAGLERLLRYCARPPLALERLALLIASLRIHGPPLSRGASPGYPPKVGGPAATGHPHRSEVAIFSFRTYFCLRLPARSGRTDQRDDLSLRSLAQTGCIRHGPRTRLFASRRSGGCAE